MVLRGTAEHTRAAALRLLAGLDPSQVLWVGDPAEQDRVPTLAPRKVAAALGRSLDAVVLDGHAGVDPDVFGCAHGLVRGGGGLVLRLPERGQIPKLGGRAHLAAHPYQARDVGTRVHQHLERALARASLGSAEPLDPAPPIAEGHPEQAEVALGLARAWSEPGPSRVALLADRGRGKSSALGLALARLHPSALDIAVTAPSVDAAAEVFRFAAAAGRGTPRFVPLPELVFGPERFDLVVVDEAAQLPVTMLRQLLQVHHRAHIAMATTTHGYEGTGRGFSLQLLRHLERGPIPLQRLTLRAPIRWAPDDPLERLTFDALLLDAEPASLPDGIEPQDADLRAVRLDRDALLRDEPALRQLFGLLVHAHYRTTPGDLQRLLDAPNLGVHAVMWREHVVAATLVAQEGGLPRERCEAMARGAERIRAHALADALVCHLGRPEAGTWPMLRSVRIATHPALRRLGLARRLVEHVHREHAPELFGTLFGATPELLAFRRRVGYRVVRLSASRGARTGEPSAMMLRPVSARACGLVDQLQAELARDLPRQLDLLRADAQTLLDPALVAALYDGLPPPAPLPPEAQRALVESYAFGPRTVESVALALLRFIEGHRDRLDRLGPEARAVIEGRVLAGHGWRRVAADAGVTVPAAMRGLRRAVRQLLDP